MKNKGLVVVLFFLVCGQHLRSQSLVVKQYGRGEGLPNGFVYTLQQDNRGFLWVSSGSEFVRFDGFHFSSGKARRAKVGQVTVSFVDSIGTLWIGYGGAHLAFYDGYYFHPVDIDSSLMPDITAIGQLDGEIFAIAQNGTCMFLSPEGYSRYADELKDKVTVLKALGTGAHCLLIGTDAGLVLYEYNKTKNTLKELFRFSSIPSSNIVEITPGKEKNSYWIGTRDEGFFHLLLNLQEPERSRVTELTHRFGFPLWNVESLYEDSMHNLWIGTNDKGLFVFFYNSQLHDFDKAVCYDDTKGFTLSSVRCIYEDRENNVWVGTFGDGLYGFFRSAVYKIPLFQGKKKNEAVTAIAVKDNTMFAATHEGIVKMNSSFETEKTILFNHLYRNIEVTSLAVTAGGNLWIGTRQHGLLHYTPENTLRVAFFSENTPENCINALCSDQSVLWMATNGGVIRYEIPGGKTKIYSTHTARLPHNKINHLLKDRNGKIWIATRSNDLVTVDRELRYELQGNVNVEFTSLAQGRKGELWAATLGYGVFMFSRDSMVNYTVKQGLLSDYSYSLVMDDSGNVWVGHREGVSKIVPSSGQVVPFGSQAGLQGDCLPNAAGLFSRKVLMGMTDGLTVFDYEAMSQRGNRLMPVMVSVKVSDKEVDESRPLVLPYGRYSLRFEFTAFNYAQPGIVRYQYKLEGWDEKWSDITLNNWAFYPRVEDGNYSFMVRVYAPDGSVTSQPLSFFVEIKKPFWKKTGFQLLGLLSFILLTAGVVYLRERRQRAFQRYLKKLLDERTAEVVRQKQELEIKNKDITDSINYARRIQSSMLPPVERLREYFSENFIVYYPRDIVSGDFYWIHTNGSKILVLCADSTGHGVPGAFMSIIGITLMKDIATSNPSLSPAELFKHLDRELRITINQDRSSDKTSDGMDACMVELDVSDYTVKIATAMRPVFVVQKGQLKIIEASKSSIGSNVSPKEKEFEEHILQMAKGDLIYMFTDGITDQFGGPSNKKFKLHQLKKLIDTIHSKPLNEQKEIIEETFRMWKGETPQLDDVLMIGLRL